MKEIGESLKIIWKEERGLVGMMVATMLLSLILLIYSLVTLRPAGSVVKIGYGDIGGYRDGSWQSMLAWSLYALTLGLFNNLVAVRVFRKNGASMAKIVVFSTIVLVVVGFVVLSRLLGES